MRNDERLRTIYEVMAPYIVRNEHNWRDYLAFASQFHKHSFDNILLVYAQDEDVSILATRKQWAAIGRNLIPRAKGVAVCVYRNAKLTLDYLFDVSQTTGKEIHPTDWQLSDEMKKALTERLSYAHGFPKQDFSQALYAMASEPNPDYLRVQSDLEAITREYDAYVTRMDGGAILSPQEAADMDDLEDTQYRLEKELEELRPIRAFVRMGDGTAAEAPAVMDEATPTDLAPLREPPAAPQVATHNFRFSEDYDLYPSGAKTKYKNNVMAIKLLKQIELEKRTATPEEQIILARYVGWGGLANAFSSTASGWENEYQELKSLLTDVEYKAAMNSTITAYYTEPDLIRHIYRALERFGFEGGPDRKILDPGMGTGNFYSVLPEQFQGSKLFGVELLCGSSQLRAAHRGQARRKGLLSLRLFHGRP